MIPNPTTYARVWRPSGALTFAGSEMAHPGACHGSGTQSRETPISWTRQQPTSIVYGIPVPASNDYGYEAWVDALSFRHRLEACSFDYPSS